jgi:DNA-binding transcriptional MerR regulator
VAKKLYYKIGEACKLLDIQPYVLRYWETEFTSLSPSKSKSGQRTYTEEDLKVIGRIK